MSVNPEKGNKISPPPHGMGDLLPSLIPPPPPGAGLSFLADPCLVAQRDGF